MISISVSTDKHEAVAALIAGTYRLGELVTLAGTPEGADLLVDADIVAPADWANRQPPVLFPPVAYSALALLGLIYTKLGNFEEAYGLLAPYQAIAQVADLLNRIQNGIELSADDFANTGDHVTLHNYAIALHYGYITQPVAFSFLQDCYLNALQNAPDMAAKAFTAKHYALLLSDAGLLKEAERLIVEQLGADLRENIGIELKSVLAAVWMKQLTVPYNTQLVAQLKETIWECLQYYEKNSRKVEEALLLTDATQVATISNSFSEALGYISRAIKIFEEEQVAELLAQAQLTKGNLLHTWAQNGNPQFYRTAVKAYQEALAVFGKEQVPHVFAEIQHQLGIIYSEIPDEVKKKSVWAAVSVSSFHEALEFFTKEDYPYEYAMICNSFGNAYTKYPAAVRSDNFEKALEWYREALAIRTARIYPIERALTLSNYLEASWYAGNKAEYDEERFADMEKTAHEILFISDDNDIRGQAKEHLEKLAQLKSEVWETVKN